MMRLGSELTVVVLGVLIALSADGWVASRADLAVESARITALRDNIDQTLATLRAAQVEAHETADALRELASGTSPARMPQLLRVGFLFGPTFHPEINVYDDLKNSGELALLRSVPLRRALAGMDATLELVRLQQSDIVTVQQLNYDAFLIRELDLPALLGDYVGLKPVDSSLPAGASRELQNLAVFKLDLVLGLIDIYEQAEEALVEVEQAL